MIPVLLVFCSAVLCTASVYGVAARDRYSIDAEYTYPSLEFSHMDLSVWRGKFHLQIQGEAI